MAYRWLPSGPPYKLLVLQMDNSILNLFNYAMLTVAPNCRTKNTWLWSQAISHTFWRTKDTVLYTASKRIQNIYKRLRRSFCKKVNGLRKLLSWLRMTLKASISANVIASFSRKGFHKSSFLDACKCSEYASEHY